VTRLIEQDGPIALSNNHAHESVYEDANRCLTLFTDERRAKTERIVRALADAYRGREARADAGRLVQRHHALQRLAATLHRRHPVCRAAAERLNYQRVEARRGFPQIMSTIQAITLLHQWQRECDEAGRLVATLGDYALARRLLARPHGPAAGRRDF